MNKTVRRLALGLSAVLFCLLLAFLLLLLEGGAEGATIINYPTALWYLLTTLTTVGYGDVYPVTAAGRAIGAVFQILSLGLLVFLLGLLVTALKGKILPKLRLFHARKKDWYIFSAPTEEGLKLSENLKQEQPEAEILFAASSGEEENLSGQVVPFTCGELIARHKGRRKDTVFCIGPDPAENEALAASLSRSGCSIFCLTDHEGEHLPESVTFFDAAECLSRLYWKEHPLTDPAERVVLIGEGPEAEALLLQGLISNVIDPKNAVRYDIFGDFEDFRRNHPVLRKEQPVSLADGTDDVLFFHEEPWNADPALLTAASRIILCFPDERKTRNLVSKLLQHFPLNGQVYGRLGNPYENVICFGSASEIYTPELVMRTALDRTARTMNEIYRRNNPAGKPWEELSEFARRSNLASADHLALKIRYLLKQDADGSISGEQCLKAYGIFENAAPELREACRRIEHSRWLRFHLLNNWSYAPVRDNQKRQHPLILPFDELSAEDQAKDDYAWELLRTLSQ